MPSSFLLLLLKEATGLNGSLFCYFFFFFFLLYSHTAHVRCIFVSILLVASFTLAGCESALGFLPFCFFNGRSSSMASSQGRFGIIRFNSRWDVLIFIQDCGCTYPAVQLYNVHQQPCTRQKSQMLVAIF